MTAKRGMLLAVLMLAIVAAWGVRSTASDADIVRGGRQQFRRVELVAAYPAIRMDESVAGIATAKAGGRETGARTWFDRPFGERWAFYTGAEQARVRLFTHIEMAVLGVGLMALLVRTMGRGIWFLLMLRVMRGRGRPGTSHGSARWARGAELRRMRPRRGCADLIVGRIGRTLVAIPEHDQYEHLLLVAPTGAGKTSGVILPNLLAEPGTRSLVITDPKRELLRKSSPGIRARYGETHVWALDFLDPALSRGYNPLAYVTDAATADLFAQTWVRNTGESKDAFWSNAARTLIGAAALHLVATEEITPPLIGLVELLCGTPAEEVRAVLSDSPVPEVRRLARGFLANMAKNERLLGSVFTELPPRFTCLNLPDVRAVTATNEIAFARLAVEPTALYLALDPQYSRTLAPLTASFFLHLFTTLTAIAKREPSGALPVSVLAYLDEFGTVGHIPEFASRMATVRSAGIGCLLVVQDLAQLTKAYGTEDADTILSNATTKLCLGRVTHDDAEYFSKLAGTATVFSANQSASRPLLLPWADRGNRGVGESQRPLITSDELRTMRDEVFVVAGHRDPIRASQRRYYDDPALVRLVPRLGTPDPCVSLRRATPLAMPRSHDEFPDDETTPPVCGDIGHLPITPAESALSDLSLTALTSEATPVAVTPSPTHDDGGAISDTAVVLTPSQERLLVALATIPNASGADLAAMLGVQRSTVRDGLMKLRRKLAVGTNDDLVAVARTRGLLTARPSVATVSAPMLDDGEAS